MATWASEETLEFSIPIIPVLNGKIDRDTRTKNIIRYVVDATVRSSEWTVTPDDLVYIVLTFNKKKTKKESQSNPDAEIGMSSPNMLTATNTILKVFKGKIYLNDKQIVGLTLVRRYSDVNGVDVLVGKPKDWRELRYDLKNA